MLHCTTAIEMQTIQKTVKNKVNRLMYNKPNKTKKTEYDDAKRNHKQSLKAIK